MISNARFRDLLLAVCGLVALLLAARPAMADLTMNFLPLPPGQRIANIANVDCRTPTLGGCLRGSSLTDPDKTPFYQELVINQGVSYYHVMIGQPNTEIAQEYYIAVATLPNGGLDCCWSNGAPFSASSGEFNGGNDVIKGWIDPLAPTVGLGGSGSGTGNPERVIFRQVIQSQDLTQETSKLSFLNKPTVNQTLSSAQMESLFKFDMSNSTYQDSTTIGVMTNRIKLFDSNQPTPFLDFDVASNAQSSKLNGGTYTYTPGIDKVGSNGSYQYKEGNYDPRPIDYRVFSNTTNIPNN